MFVGKRVRVRALEDRDIGIYLSLINNPEIRLYAFSDSGAPVSPKMAEQLFAEWTTGVDEHKANYWFTAEKIEDGVVDPFLTLTVPSEVIGAAAVEMLVRIIDSYLTGAPDTAPQDRVSEALLQVLWESAPRAVTDSFDLEARTQLTWISTMGRLGLHVEGRQPVHFPLWFTQTAVSDRLNESKGRVLAAILCNVLTRLVSHHPLVAQRLAQLGQRVFCRPSEAGWQDALTAIREWLEQLGLSTAPGSLGLGEEAVELAAETLRRWGDRDGQLCGLTASDLQACLLDP